MSLSSDEISYPPWPIVEAQPERLAVAARLRGLKPAPADRCRFLEVGCGAGGHLLPLAATFPESRFVGLDIDTRAIESASRLAGELGLDNVQLLALDVAEAPAKLGGERFDYAIAHGVYSWITDRGREALLELFGRTLSEEGVAYVSYNAYPGFHVREVLRDMLRHHAEGAASTREATNRARELSAALLDSPLFETAPELLRHELAALASASDVRLAHDDLADARGFWVEDFSEVARRHELRFMGDVISDLETTLDSDPVSREREHGVDDAASLEAYRDLLSVRRFKRSLLCRAERQPSVSPVASRLRGMHVALPPRTPRPESADATWTLSGRDGRSAMVREPTLRAALLRVAERWPESASVAELEAMLQGPEPARLGFLEALLRLHDLGAIWLATAPATCVAGVSARPRASVYARACGRLGLPIASQYHEQVDVPSPLRALLVLLDGSRDHATLRREFAPGGAALDLTSLLDDLARNALLTG